MDDGLGARAKAGKGGAAGLGQRGRHDGEVDVPSGSLPDQVARGQEAGPLRAGADSVVETFNRSLERGAGCGHTRRPVNEGFRCPATFRQPAPGAGDEPWCGQSGGFCGVVDGTEPGQCPFASVGRFEPRSGARPIVRNTALRLPPASGRRSASMDQRWIGGRDAITFYQPDAGGLASREFSVDMTGPSPWAAPFGHPPAWQGHRFACLPRSPRVELIIYKRRSGAGNVRRRKCPPPFEVR